MQEKDDGVIQTNPRGRFFGSQDFLKIRAGRVTRADGKLKEMTPEAYKAGIRAAIEEATKEPEKPPEEPSRWGPMADREFPWEEVEK